MWCRAIAVNRLAIFLMMVALTSCAFEPQGNLLANLDVVVATANISDVGRSPQGATVLLKGKVIGQAPLLSGTAFELQDATGKIWVVTKMAVPPQGNEVVVKGTLRYQAGAAQNQGVYVEQIP